MKQIIRLYFILCLILPCDAASKKTTPNNSIFHAHLAGTWYEKEPKKLSHKIDAFLKIAKTAFPVIVTPGTRIEALLVPHAGHEFSGLNAATCYQTLLDENGKKNNVIKRVIILGTDHYSANNIIALPDFLTYQTPLGEVPIDTTALEILQKNKFFRIEHNPFTVEHSIEIQLPFLQKTVAHFSLVPLIVGAIPEEKIVDVARTLKSIIDDKTVIVVSSDFIHFGPNYNYLPYSKDILDNVRATDSAAVEAIVAKSPAKFNHIIKQTGATICGRHPIAILLALMQLNTWETIESRLTCYYASAQMENAHMQDKKGSLNSAQLLAPIPDEKVENSVSYVSMVFTNQNRLSLSPKDRLTGYEKKALLVLAQRSIQNAFMPAEKKLPPHLLFPIKSAELSATPGAFVTLNTKNGDLRGCIGTVTTELPLYQTIYQMSIAAAFEDNRFLPLTKKELPDITFDITVLEKPVAIEWPYIVIGTHGIILEKNGHSALFLPQVAREQGWDLPTTLNNLSRKAGLPEDAWKTGTTFKVFEGYEIN